MPSADRSQSGLVSWLTALLHKLRVWTRQEIVSDDPWDRGESLFSNASSNASSDAPQAPDKVAGTEPEADAARSASIRRDP